MLEWVKSENHSSDHHNTSTGFAYTLYMRTYKYYINYVMLITWYAWQSHVIFRRVSIIWIILSEMLNR